MVLFIFLKNCFLLASNILVIVSIWAVVSPLFTPELNSMSNVIFEKLTGGMQEMMQAITNKQNELENRRRREASMKAETDEHKAAMDVVKYHLDMSGETTAVNVTMNNILDLKFRFSN
jgi:hypothetical protein